MAIKKIIDFFTIKTITIVDFLQIRDIYNLYMATFTRPENITLSGRIGQEAVISTSVQIEDPSKSGRMILR